MGVTLEAKKELNSLDKYVQERSKPGGWPYLTQESDDRHIEEIRRDIKYHESQISTLLEQKERYATNEMISRIKTSTQELRDARKTIIDIHTSALHSLRSLGTLNDYIQDVIRSIERQKQEIADKNSREYKNLVEREGILNRMVKKANKEQYLSDSIMVMQNAHEVAIAYHQAPPTMTVHVGRIVSGSRINIIEGDNKGGIQGQFVDIEQFRTNVGNKFGNK